MKHFWALPAVLRVSLVLAAHRTFSVNDDLLAYPQFRVQWVEEYVSDTFADSKLQRSERDKDSTANLQSTEDGSSSTHIQHYERSPTPGSDDAPYGMSDKSTAADDYEYETMVLHKQRFLCAIPRIAATDDDGTSGANNDTTLAQQREEEAKELARAKERGWELLSGMQDNCVYYISGWWSYSYCFNQGVRQFHALPVGRGMASWPPQEDSTVPGFMLGTHEGYNGGNSPREDSVSKKQSADQSLLKSQEAKTGELVIKGDSRYLVQKLEGGTVCDLTGKGRRIEVQFHCNPSVGIDRISLIKELSTCSYLMVIQTPRLCNDVAFLPPQQEIPNDIICQPVLKQDEVESYLQDLAAIKEALKKSEDWIANAASPPEHEQPDQETPEQESQHIVLQLVGDIIVGGRNIVPDDLEIEKSAIVGGIKQTYIDTVASSDGKTMSEADLEKLGYGDKETVDKLVATIQKKADGRAWKLDVVDTPRGREYIGYFEEPDNQPEQQASEGAREGEQDDGAPGDAEQNDDDGSEEEYFFKEEL